MVCLQARSFCKPYLTFQSSNQGRPSGKRARCARAGMQPVQAFKNFGDGLLDYMEAGPKLRKWYGEGDRKQGKNTPDPEDEEEVEAQSGDAVLVTDAETPVGELVLLQLILARLKVAALVRNPAAAIHSYGSYITPVAGNIDDRNSLKQALQKSRAVICTGKLGALPELLQQRQVDHVVLLSTVARLALGSEGAGLFGRLLGTDQAVLADESREEALQDCKAPLTIVRVGKMLDTPGGGADLHLVQGGSKPVGKISREDVAQVLVRALQKRPKATLRVAIDSKPAEAQFRDWDKLFTNLDEAV